MIPYHYKRESLITLDRAASEIRTGKVWASFQSREIDLKLASQSISASLAFDLKAFFDYLANRPQLIRRGKSARVGKRFSAESRTKSAAARLKRSQGARTGSVWPKGHRPNPGKKSA